jgi:hypothetical protein
MMMMMIVLMMEAERTSETSVDIQLSTRQYTPEDSELHSRRRENLKSHNTYFSKRNDLEKCRYITVSDIVLWLL